MSKTVYCAQPFWRQGRSLAPGETLQFMTADRAITGGEILAKGAAGVAVFSLTGEPDVNYWGEPVLLWTTGEVPVVGDIWDAA